MTYTDELQAVISKAFLTAKEQKHRYLMPEHLLYAMTMNKEFAELFSVYGGDADKLCRELMEYLQENAEYIDGDEESEITVDFQKVFLMAEEQAKASGRKLVEVSHLLASILALEDSYAVYYLMLQGVNMLELLGDLSRRSIADDSSMGGIRTEDKHKAATGDGSWCDYVDCINDTCLKKKPLIGREKEMERTIQILCRMDKNNVLHVGEPGVGKTAIVYGLARRIVSDQVPDFLKGSRIFSIDLGTLLAGTQYRGDFEKRFKLIMDGLSKEDKPIVYLDEIHNIVGAGAVNGGSFDVSNMLKPYLAAGHIRFIGSTTYEEYKKYFSVSKSLVRRFQKVDIHEPDEADAIEIVKGLKSRYEKFHGVKYGKGVMEYAVVVSKKYINERFLPDKAIDLIDEAGAYRKLHPLDQKTQTVGKALIDDVLSQICSIPKQMVQTDEIEKLSVLENKLMHRVFGQEEAISQICNAVKFSKAGLAEEDKPLASFLFVGATGVGKTESAKALAEELGISLIRFDMSEYAEKHAVAKLIGAPAGYVGYEEGGLLTEEIRRHPHAVLLLDEIEKAHPDIYHVLLQVMDYATLTDNQGRKADFRNVILIMTSNAGASRIGKTMVGFGNRRIDEEAVHDAVNKTFQPEFRNRLSRIILFNSIDDKMAEKITEKKLAELQQKLLGKKVELEITKKAVAHIKEAGISKEYGAREIDRVITAEVKPLLVQELLFGKLKKGGRCVIDEENRKLLLR